MTVMPANNTCWLVDYWAGRYGGLGHLYSPARKDRPRPHLPYVLDNGVYAAWAKHRPWQERPFLEHVERYAFQELRPQWVVVPDAVADRDLTLAKWAEWAPRLKSEYHLCLALAVQDRMTPTCVRELSPAPDVIFVGGTTQWKWETVKDWCRFFERVHVGRVNSAEKLDLCASLGAESCDGTGWFRGRSPQILALGRFLAKQAGKFDEAEIARVVRFSRLKGRQNALPLNGANRASF